LKKLNIGIVGLPNVGKSTIFNALIQHIKAEVANYPFCTIEPNIGTVIIPDERLFKIAEVEKSPKVTPATIEFVDIAGLVKGASKGEGLGNQFLSHIRTVSAIAQVLRCFENPEVVHVESTIDPVRDADIIKLELILADLQTVEKRIAKIEKIAKSGDKKAKKELEILLKAKEILNSFHTLREKKEVFQKEELQLLQKTIFPLTLKPMMYIANIGEEDLPDGKNNPYVKNLKEKAKKENIPLIILCGKVESEIIELSPEERKEYLKIYGLSEPGLHKLIKAGYKLLELITFFTTGPKETRAWIIKKGTKAPQAAGEIHSDMEKGFICAEVLSWEEFVKIGSFSKAKELGVLRIEGKEYIVQDGDLIHFRFNV